MRKNQLLVFFFFLLVALQVQAQQTETKYFQKGTKAGEVYVLYSYGEYSGGTSQRVYVIDVPRSNTYFLSTLCNLEKSTQSKVYMDDMGFAYLMPPVSGWQNLSATDPVNLTAGKHKITIEGKGPMVPMVEEIKFTTSDPRERGTADAATTAFLDKVNSLRQQPVITQAAGDDENGLTNKVLANPQGEYNHAIDTNFTYSHFSSIYLTVGYHNFTTSGSTISRSLTIFNQSNYTYSWANANSGPGGESGLYLYVGLAGYYSIMLRPTTNGTGTTNIIYNGTTLVSGAVVGGRTYAMSALKGGSLNFFTCKLTGGDTRMLACRYFTSSARGYNDDYYGGGGSWNWGLASRIKKDFNGNDSVQYSFVCAYSPTSTGVCDIYMGAGNSNLHQLEPLNFPLLTDDDAIRSAPADGNYNCISWSGGITNTWVWPPSSLSTYNCTSANYLQCFDNFYSNNPVRYPGAWNYTRTGATEANSIVDLWKTASAYTHASVKKTGNNHPHGYDWESKPGGTNRTFHPRYALTQANWYGSVSNYYKPTGTYARNAGQQFSFDTDADAVKAGVAVFDVAKLTSEANDKLSTLLRKTNISFTRSFEELYAAWDATKAANASMSDPAMYCKNAEYKAMEAFALKNPRQAMLLVFDKFVNANDHPISELLLTLTRDKYMYLLDEVKTERLANPNDATGRYRIHGDHDNGVLYIEKILKLLQEETEVLAVTDVVNVVVSPNPVKDRMTVQVTMKNGGKLSVTAVSAQTRQTKVLQAETMLAAGTHRFNMDISGFAGNSGDIIAVQVMLDGQMKTVKVLVTK